MKLVQKIFKDLTVAALKLQNELNNQEGRSNKHDFVEMLQPGQRRNLRSMNILMVLRVSLTIIFALSFCAEVNWTPYYDFQSLLYLAKSLNKY